MFAPDAKALRYGFVVHSNTYSVANAVALVSKLALLAAVHIIHCTWIAGRDSSFNVE
jgi:hypothetical protein